MVELVEEDVDILDKVLQQVYRMFKSALSWINHDILRNEIWVSMLELAPEADRIIGGKMMLMAAKMFTCAERYDFESVKVGCVILSDIIFRGLSGWKSFKDQDMADILLAMDEIYDNSPANETRMRRIYLNVVALYYDEIKLEKSFQTLVAKHGTLGVDVILLDRKLIASLRE